jgi:hypothetical protein
VPKLRVGIDAFLRSLLFFIIMLNQEMPRRDFMWTTLGLVTGVTGGASFGAAVNNKTHVVDNASQAKKKDLPKRTEAQASNQQRLHQAQKADTTEAANDKSQDSPSNNQAKNIGNTALTGGVIGMAGGYYVDEAFHHLAVGSNELESRRRY